MQIESIKCPNCGGNLSIGPAMKQVYCNYCDSLLVLYDSPRNETEKRNDGSDNPIKIEVVSIKAEPVQASPLSNQERFMKVLAGICFVHNSSIPFKLNDYVWWETYLQEVKKTLFGERRGKWKQTEDYSRHESTGQFLSNKYGFVCEATESAPVENISFSKADRYGESDHYVKKIMHEVKYKARMLPDSIKRHTDYYPIINSGKTNQYIQNMIDDIIRAVPDSPTIDSFGISVDMDHINIYISNTPGRNEYKFHTYGLADCASNTHRYAMLSIITGEILNKIGNKYAIELIDTEIDDDLEQFDHCYSGFKHLSVVKKTYQSW